MREDERGEIRDLIVTDTCSVTHITFTPGAVRGNHYHKHTEQIDIVLDGELVYAQDGYTQKAYAGQVITHTKGVKHAYKAVGSAAILSVCFGVRRGEHYEEDTYRLEPHEKLL